MFGRVVEAVEQVLRKLSVSISDIEGIGRWSTGEKWIVRMERFSKQFTVEPVSYFSPFAGAIWNPADYD